MPTNVKNQVGIPWIVGGAVGLVAGSVVLSLGSRGGDLGVAGFVIALANLALLSSVWINQRRMSDRLGIWMSTQLDAAEEMSTLLKSLEADYIQRRLGEPTRENKADVAPRPSHVLH